MAPSASDGCGAGGEFERLERIAPPAQCVKQHGEDADQDDRQHGPGERRGEHSGREEGARTSCTAIVARARAIPFLMYSELGFVAGWGLSSRRSGRLPAARPAGRACAAKPCRDVEAIRPAWGRPPARPRCAKHYFLICFNLFQTVLLRFARAGEDSERQCGGWGAANDPEGVQPGQIRRLASARRAEMRPNCGRGSKRKCAPRSARELVASDKELEAAPA